MRQAEEGNASESQAQLSLQELALVLDLDLELLLLLFQRVLPGLSLQELGLVELGLTQAYWGHPETAAPHSTSRTRTGCQREGLRLNWQE